MAAAPPTRSCAFLRLALVFVLFTFSDGAKTAAETRQELEDAVLEQAKLIETELVNGKVRPGGDGWGWSVAGGGVCFCTAFPALKKQDRAGAHC